MASPGTKNIAEAIYLSGDAKRSAEFLKRRRLLGRKEAILEKLQNIVDDEEGVVRAKVTSAQTLSDSTRQDLVQKIKNRYGADKVVLEEVVALEVLGGVKIQVGDEVIDLSYKNKINNLKQVLVN